MRPVHGTDQGPACACGEQGPVRQSVLAADFGLSPHSITDIVDGLERRGMAERRPDPTDRRAKLVAITDVVMVCVDVANATRQRLLTHIFGALSEADRATLLRLLDGLDEAAQQLIAAPGRVRPHRPIVDGCAGGFLAELTDHDSLTWGNSPPCHP